MDDGRGSDGIASLVAALMDDDDFVRVTIEAVRTEVPAYAQVPTESLVASVERNRQLAGLVLVEGAVPPSGEIWQAEVSTVERLQQGVEIQDIMGGFRAVIASVQRWMVDHAAAHGVDAPEALGLSQLLWRLSDAFSARAADAYRRHDIARSVADEQRRVEWVTRLLAGELSAEEIEQGCAAYGVDRDEVVHAVCVAPDLVGELQPLREQLFHEQGAMVVPADGGLIGFTSTPPMETDVVVAIGPGSRVGELADSFAIAQEVLAAAQLGADSGVHSLDSLSWRVAVPSQPAVNALLRERYIDPLLAQGAFGALVVEALDAWLRHGRSIPRSAQSIPVHVNTLRYRLARFEELTNSSLDDTDTLIELSWALYAHATHS